MELEIPEINKLIKEVEDLKVLMTSNEIKLTKQWYNDVECWNLKGGGSLATFRSNRYYQPKGGIPDAKVCGRKVWSRNTVLEWLQITDDELQEYHKRYHTGATKK